MSSTNFRFRNATPRDLRENFARFDPDRPLYRPALWKELPRLFESLLETKRVRFGLLEDEPDGPALMFGGFTFVDEKLFSEAVDPRHFTLSDALFSLAAKKEMPFLSPKQIAAGNVAGSLIGFTFSGTPEMSLGPAARNDEDLLLCPAAHRLVDFFLRGYHMREIWHESAVPRVADFVRGFGFRAVRETPCADGGVRFLSQFTPEDARGNPGFAAANYIWTVEPKLDLSFAEQELMELALLGGSDADIAEMLAIGEDGLKKRWRSVYARVSAAEPSLIPVKAAPQMKRKLILEALRERLEEIRPYRRRAARATGLR